MWKLLCQKGRILNPIGKTSSGSDQARKVRIHHTVCQSILRNGDHIQPFLCKTWPCRLVRAQLGKKMFSYSSVPYLSYLATLQIILKWYPSGY
jgi:hypothetical protein